MSETFNAKFRAVLNELENPVKDNNAKIPTKSGRLVTYDYEDLASILNLIRPVLNKHNLGQYQESFWVSDSRGYILRTHVFDDNEDHIKDERPLRFEDNAQNSGSYETYMRRYALKTVFGLAGEDDDGATTAANTPQNESNPSNSTPKPKSPENRADVESTARLEWTDKIKDLKAEAVGLGILPEILTAKVNLILSGVPYAKAPLIKYQEIAEYLEGVIEEQRNLENVAE